MIKIFWSGGGITHLNLQILRKWRDNFQLLPHPLALQSVCFQVQGKCTMTWRSQLPRRQWKVASSFAWTTPQRSFILNLSIWWFINFLCLCNYVPSWHIISLAFVTNFDSLLLEKHVEAGHLHMFYHEQQIQHQNFSYPDDSIDLPRVKELCSSNPSRCLWNHTRILLHSRERIAIEWSRGGLLLWRNEGIEEAAPGHLLLL